MTLHSPLKKDAENVEYESSMANVVGIQEENKTIEDLQKQLQFNNSLYLQQNQQLQRTQEYFFCPICL